MSKFQLFLILALSAALFSFGAMSASCAQRLDRRAIVGRHNIDTDANNFLIPVGNGSICFNADETGMQTTGGGVMSNWGWFYEALPEGYTENDLPATGTFQTGRLAGPDLFPKDKAPLERWLIENPRKMGLGRVRLIYADGKEIAKTDILPKRRFLDLWQGLLTSEFRVGEADFTVETVVGNSDTVALRLEQSASAEGRFVLELAFPYPSTQTDEPWVGDYRPSDRHRTELTDRDGFQLLTHRFGASAMRVCDYSIGLLSPAGQSWERVDENTFRLPLTEPRTDLIFAFIPDAQSSPDRWDSGEYRPDFDRLRGESVSGWESFWRQGGAVDLSLSEDPRWFELERRIVLSQYQLKISDSGEYPAAEAGLLAMDCWCDRFHMEMVWWHLAHWFLWQRERYADRALGCYEQFKDGAALLAKQLGYVGYKWQKSVGPNGVTAPWRGNQVLLWKEPHPIFFAELDYRARPCRQTLEKWLDIIDGTADHMADYVTADENGICHLDPVMPASELGIVRDTFFDLAYWQIGLSWANRWHERLGIPTSSRWEEVRAHMAPFPLREDGIYHRAPEGVEEHWEHPDQIGALGQFSPLQLDRLDRAAAVRTVEYAVEHWEWEKCWGWDFPWAAMAAARCGRADLAVEMLLHDSPRNQYDQRGVNTGGPCPYLPGNGGLLYAVAMMCAGWDDGPDKAAASKDTVRQSAPGFPQKWHVRWENLSPAP
ncbi:MAG: hypothetical protein IJH68_04710 [Thermoguttaceae bacterium]|nr:hypothetical protein [Thermoguttaceae bacterium]